MLKGVRQARQMVAVKCQNAFGTIPGQTVHQDLQHLIRATQSVKIAQQLAALRQARRVERSTKVGIDRSFRLEPGSVIAHGDGENKDAWTRGIERTQHLVRKIGI